MKVIYHYQKGKKYSLSKLINMFLKSFRTDDANSQNISCRQYNLTNASVNVNYVVGVRSRFYRSRSILSLGRLIKYILVSEEHLILTKEYEERLSLTLHGSLLGSECGYLIL